MFVCVCVCCRYLSDHGDALGDHNLWRKGYPYEQVASVPLYARWPKSWDADVAIPRGTVLPHLVELRDVFPTLAHAAGISLPPTSVAEAPDGDSWLSLLLRPQGEVSMPSWREFLMLELATCQALNGLNWVALTDGITKYVRHLGDGKELLFDLAADRYEQRDLAPANRSAVLAWRARLAAEFRREGRGPKFVLPDGSLPLARNCAEYETIEAATSSRSPLPQTMKIAAPASTTAGPRAAPLANIVFLLSDDQDVDGADAKLMRETQRLLVDKGAVARNMFAHTPICGPSRAQILTGRYLHNLKWDPTAPLPRPRSEKNCMHVNMSLVQDKTFARHLQEAGYTVGLFGKYLNWPADWHHVPAGFEAWFANGGGDYLSPRFVASGLADLGYPDGTWQGTPDDYSTSVIGNVSTAWITSVATGSRPFLAYIGVKAAHEPFTPAPWYADRWDDDWPAHEPRPPNWNCSFESRRHHHGCIATAPMLTDAAASVITGAFKNRWRTLLSLDDLVRATYDACDKAGVVDRTYFISTSDHGFQLGHFNIPMDKRHVYDWDTRVPFVIRGPGIPAGLHLEQPATLVDLAPTFLAMAGISKPASMDGRSLLGLLVNASDSKLWAQLSPAAQRHLLQVGTGEAVAVGWRTYVLLEHYFFTENIKCVSNCSMCSSECTRHDSNCADAIHGRTCWATFAATWAQDPLDCTQECYPTETRANNFAAIRHTGPGGKDTLYAEFHYGNLDEAPIDFAHAAPSHIEHFDAAKDPWMMNNLHYDSRAAGDGEESLARALHAFVACKGSACP